MKKYAGYFFRFFCSSKKYFTLYLFFIIALCSSATFAQSLNEDSIQHIIDVEKNDSVKVNAMQLYAGYLVNQKHNDEKVFSLLNSSISLAEKNKYFFAIANAHILFSDFYFLKSDWVKSIASAKDAIHASAKIKEGSRNKKMRYQANVDIAENYAYEGDYTASLEYRLLALSIIDSTDENYLEKGEVYVGVINDFRHLKQYSKALEYINKAEPLFDKMDTDMKFNFMYEHYQNLIFFEKTDEAKSLLNKYDSLLNVYPLTAQGKIDFASLSNKLHGQFEMSYTKNYKDALFYFQKYFDLSVQGKDKVHTGIALNKMGIAYDSLHEYPKAITTFKASYDSFMNSGAIDYAYKSANEMALIYQKTGNFKDAVFYAGIASNLKDSLDNEEKLKELNFLEAKYEASQKEKQITTLTLKNTQKEIEVAKRNRMLQAGGIFIIVMLFVIGLLYRNSKQKQLIAIKEQKLNEEHIKFLERQQQVVSLQSMLNGQEAERTRIAKDLHDGLGGLFSTVKMYFSTLEHQQAALKENELFRKSFEMVDTAATEVRRIAHNMMPEVLMKLGLNNAVHDLCNNMSAGRLLQVSFQESGMQERLSVSTEIMLYRIVQELLNNIVKHAQASKAIVQFIRDGNRLSVTVEDDGRGFDTARADDNKHAGMESVKSRVTYLNGKIQVDSQKDVGTTIMMDFLINES